MLRVETLNAFYGKIQVLYDVGLKVNQGNIISVIGSNGAGKTSLMRSITGLLKNKEGDIYFFSERIDVLEPHEIVGKGIVLVPEGRKIFANMTTMENLVLGSYLPLAKKERERNIEYVFRIFPVLEERRRQISGTLSGGEQQMLAIGRALMAFPKLLLMDEPSLGLAPVVVKNIFDSIKKINQAGTTVLLVEQDVYKSLVIADEGYVLENGKVVLQGSGDALLQNEYLKKAYLGI